MRKLIIYPFWQSAQPEEKTIKEEREIDAACLELSGYLFKHPRSTSIGSLTAI